jgi:hypothetical protein
MRGNRKKKSNHQSTWDTSLRLTTVGPRLMWELVQYVCQFQSLYSALIVMRPWTSGNYRLRYSILAGKVMMVENACVKA